MKGALDFDPMKCDYGPATDAVRQILLEWADIDWFSALRGDSDSDAGDARAIELFNEHIALGWTHAPDLFPPDIKRTARRSSWSDFNALCDRVRYIPSRPATEQSSFDWKFNVLKKLCSIHSAKYDWDVDKQIEGVAILNEHTKEMPKGTLFMRFNDYKQVPQTIWTGATPRIQLELEPNLTPEDVSIAQWYLGYANMDVMEALEWQLAEQTNRLDTNPFLPLIRLYAAGRYPFALGEKDFVLFGFGKQLS